MVFYDLDLQRKEGFEQTVEVCGGGCVAMCLAPAGGDRGVVEHRFDVVLLMLPHRGADFEFGDFDAVAREEFDEGQHGSAAAEIEDSAGDIEDHDANADRLGDGGHGWL